MAIQLARLCFYSALLASVSSQVSYAQSSVVSEIPHDWLKTKITVEEAERKYPGIPNDPRAARFPSIARPFAFLNERWEALKAKMQPGDQLWEYNGPISGGIALARDGKVIDSIELWII